MARLVDLLTWTESGNENEATVRQVLRRQFRCMVWKHTKSLSGLTIALQKGSLKNTRLSVCKLKENMPVDLGAVA